MADRLNCEKKGVESETNALSELKSELDTREVNLSKAEGTLKQREAEAVELTDSLNKREMGIDDKERSTATKITEEEERLGELTSMCQVASRQLKSLNDEANDVRTSIDSSLVDANKQLNSLLLEVGEKEDELSDLTSRLASESREETMMNERKHAIVNEVSH